MSNVYERLGVPTIINAKGAATRVSGAPMPPDIAAAMQEATQHCVDMAQLQGRASEIITDAASQLPPTRNLRRFLEEGADLVSISGGKAILGPQGSGILCGRRDLVASALLQNLDHDLFFEQWRPPPALFAGLNLRGLPQHGIGRSCKAGKEQIVALLIALGLFVGEDIGERNQRCLARLKDMEAHLEPEIARGVRIEESANGAEPRLVLEVASRPHGPSAFNLVIALQDGSPAVHVDPSFVNDGRVVARALCLKEGDAPVIARRVNEVLARARSPG